MDARRIPFEEEFDVVGAFDVLEHIEDDAAVMRQMWQAARPGGGVVVTVPQHRFLWSQQDEYACHCRRYEADELKRKVMNAGFEPVRMSSFVSLLLPAMFAARLGKRRPVANYDGMAELKIGGIANLALEKTMNLERTMIRAGFSFPAGGSLLLVARKP
jgi:SAM-dependent methyltransferase